MFSNSVDMLIKKKKKSGGKEEKKKPIFRMKSAQNEQLFLEISMEGTSFSKRKTEWNFWTNSASHIKSCGV